MIATTRSLLTFLISSVISFSAAAQDDFCNLEISLLTCTPGQELYSTFGHTAIRLKDSLNDVVFNYGTFNFEEPDFYTKFVRGKLNYFLSVENFADFVTAYQFEKRGIIEQQLSLDCEEKEAIAQALIQNAAPQNRNYKYDFLFDNCTTRAGVILLKHIQDQVTQHNILPEETPTFRDQLHEYLRRGGQRWSELGIDILLGSRIDRKVTNTESQFLPDYLLKGFDSTLVRGRSIVLQKKILLDAPPVDRPIEFLPVWAFGLLFILVLLLSLKTSREGVILKIVDRVLFTATGLLGFLLVFMWTATDHASCRDNLNLAWALPFHSIMIWFKPANRFRNYYFRVTTSIALLLLVFWLVLPQALNNGLIPVVALLAYRSYRNVIKR